MFMSIFDLHIHTRRYSGCSFIQYEEVITQAVCARLNGLALTEHGMRWPDSEFNRLRDTGLEHGLVMINGQEIHAKDSSGHSEGEYLIFGMKRSLTKTKTAAQLTETVHKEGGIIIAAHPYKLSRGGRSHYYGAGDLIYRLQLDGIELYHPDHSEGAMSKIRKAMEQMNIPGTGGSDAHKILNIGSYVTVFEKPIHNEEEFLCEIRAGRLSAEKRP